MFLAAHSHRFPRDNGKEGRKGLEEGLNGGRKKRGKKEGREEGNEGKKEGTSEGGGGTCQSNVPAWPLSRLVTPITVLSLSSFPLLGKREIQVSESVSGAEFRVGTGEKAHNVGALRPSLACSHALVGPEALLPEAAPHIQARACSHLTFTWMARGRWGRKERKRTVGEPARERTTWRGAHGGARPASPCGGAPGSLPLRPAHGPPPAPRHSLPFQPMARPPVTLTPPLEAERGGPWQGGRGAGVE